MQISNYMVVTTELKVNFWLRHKDITSGVVSFSVNEIDSILFEFENNIPQLNALQENLIGRYR